MNFSDFQRRLKEERLRLGLSRDALSAQIGCNVGQLQYWENSPASYGPPNYYFEGLYRLGFDLFFLLSGSRYGHHTRSNKQDEAFLAILRTFIGSMPRDQAFRILLEMTEEVRWGVPALHEGNSE